MEQPPLNFGSLQKLLQQFGPALAGNISSYAQNLTKLNLPIYDEQTVIQICQTVEQIFANEPMILQINEPIFVIGDIHGHILDLFRIFRQLGMPDITKYLFLGDLVDRGEFSVETILFLFIIKALYPNNIYIIRGNHEFEFMANQFGFSDQLTDVYGHDALQKYFYAVFSQMPLGASIFQTYLAVHGGIGPSLFSVNQISRQTRPLVDFVDDNITSLLWSDPADISDYFSPSSRGSGYFYGKEALHEFLVDNKYKMLIRGHECVQNGIEYKFNNEVCTVFSASNYCGISGNACGVLELIDANERKEHFFPPLPYLLRKYVFPPRPLMQPRKISEIQSAKRFIKLDSKGDFQSLPKPTGTKMSPIFDNPTRIGTLKRQKTSPILSFQPHAYSVRNTTDDPILESPPSPTSPTKSQQSQGKLPTLSSSMKSKKLSFI